MRTAVKGEFELVGKTFGRCQQCQVIRFRIIGQQPVDKFICGAVRVGWSEKVERREGVRS